MRLTPVFTGCNVVADTRAVSNVSLSTALCLLFVSHSLCVQCAGVTCAAQLHMQMHLHLQLMQCTAAVRSCIGTASASLVAAATESKQSEDTHTHSHTHTLTCIN